MLLSAQFPASVRVTHPPRCLAQSHGFSCDLSADAVGTFPTSTTGAPFPWPNIPKLSSSTPPASLLRVPCPALSEPSYGHALRALCARRCSRPWTLRLPAPDRNPASAWLLSLSAFFEPGECALQAPKYFPVFILPLPSSRIYLCFSLAASKPCVCPDQSS